jgi:hypothetical protein
MDTSQEPNRGARVLGPKDGEVAGAPEFRTDRFMIDGARAADHGQLHRQRLAGPAGGLSTAAARSRSS